MSHLSKGKQTAHDPPPIHHLSPSHASPAGPSSSTGGHAPPSTSAFVTPLTSPATGSGAGLPNFPSQAAPSHLTANGLNINLPVPVPSLRSRESTRTTDRTDALWAEMQATLEAVELTAGGSSGGGGAGRDTAARTSTARVFSPDHERKLDELRAAQIALAQAWARSEADEAIETTAAGGAGAAGEGTERSGGKKVEEETEVDILLARKRREANDRYFQRVNQGVLDVVSKLEEVAIAMRAVEQESKELWGDDNESITGSAKT
ncbi:hypothetical protein F5144DRAFT_544835 [Chaetomium tenue]|uniref:Uncharacterized protein n=1 Tax=Chaetomium tenue TaxID=1854479 RepID=A0ACB7PIZ2_9PEZI|nr:hypothetical protein F5144DRAFT_544835 [Chaetomium globosum]